MHILVFGRSGQVATELQRRAALHPAGVTLQALGREEADFTNPASCVAALKDRKADAVINAVAYTAVDKAEEEESLATRINGETPGALARVCAAEAIPFVHISTDYVFDGAGQSPIPPDTPTAPLGAYGRSKLAGELAVRAAEGPHAILRTSWVFSAHGNNFVKTMLRLGRTREALSIVADQIGGPTGAADIAEACLTIAETLTKDPDRSGTYHFAGGPDVSWADFAREIFSQSGHTVSVTDIPASDYPTPAARPANSRLDMSTLTAAFDIPRPDWKTSLSGVLKDLGEI